MSFGGTGGHVQKRNLYRPGAYFSGCRHLMKAMTGHALVLIASHELKTEVHKAHLTQIQVQR
jgi:hypothetical protein